MQRKEYFYRNVNDESDDDDDDELFDASSSASDCSHEGSDSDRSESDSEEDSDEDEPLVSSAKQLRPRQSSAPPCDDAQARNGDWLQPRATEDDDFFRSLGLWHPRSVEIKDDIGLEKALGRRSAKLFASSGGGKRASGDRVPAPATMSQSLVSPASVPGMRHVAAESIGLGYSDGYMEVDPFARTMNPSGSTMFHNVRSLLINRRNRKWDPINGPRLHALQTAGIFASRDLLRQVNFTYPQVSAEQLKSWAWPTTTSAAVPAFVIPPRGTLYPSIGRSIAVGSMVNQRTRIAYWCVYKCPLRYPFVSENTGGAEFWKGFHAVPKVWADGSLNPSYQRTMVVVDIDAFQNYITFLTIDGDRRMYSLEEMWNLDPKAPDYFAIKLALKDVINDYPQQLRPLLGFGKLSLSKVLENKLQVDDQQQQEDQDDNGDDNGDADASNTDQGGSNDVGAPTDAVSAAAQQSTQGALPITSDVQRKLYGGTPGKPRKIPAGQRLVDMMPKLGPAPGAPGVMGKDASKVNGFQYSIPTSGSPYARGTNIQQ